MAGTNKRARGDERDAGDYTGAHRTDREVGTLPGGEPLIGRQAGNEGRDATLVVGVTQPAED